MEAAGGGGRDEDALGTTARMWGRRLKRELRALVDARSSALAQAQTHAAPV